MKSALTANAGEKALLLGNEAIARGALEAGATFFSCYPGTPSSEVLDALTVEALRIKQETGKEPPFHAEYSINEKVAMEAAAGAALAGARSMVAMKHVGLNVAADPLFTSAYIGLPGGLVVLSADDPGCHSSQNEQDNRQYARFAGLPCLEPTSPAEARDMTRAAFAMARELEQPVLLRTTTRISHMRGPVLPEEPAAPSRVEVDRNPGRFVPVPQVALKRHRELVRQLSRAEEMAEQSPFNKVSGPAGEYGVIASGVARNYLADALAMAGWRDRTAVLELGMSWPLPQKMILDFLRAHPRVLVLEEGASLLEKDIRALAQQAGLHVDIAGKDGELTGFAEFSASAVLNRLGRWLGLEPPQARACASPRKLPSRPPNLCPGCAHRAVYYAVRQMFGDEAIYSSDIGCYTLGLVPPLKTADFLVCMGSSVSAGSGYAKASPRPVIGFIGDSTFFHSGMTGLANAVFNRHNILLVILDNGTTAMTGHQPNPGMRQDALGGGSRHLDIEAIVKSLGVEHCRKAKASNLAAINKALAELGPLPGVRVLIAEEPCMLFARRKLGLKKGRVAQVVRQGQQAEDCLRKLACPAFYRAEGEIRVDENLCSGCMLCLQIAPQAFGARRAGQ